MLSEPVRPLGPLGPLMAHNGGVLPNYCEGTFETSELAGRIVDGICAEREILAVEDVVARFNIGKRTLQRLFDRYVGVSPIWVIRVYRLHEIIERLKAGEAIDFAVLSQDLGYFDQPHFVKDFKSIVGRTPSEYARPPRT